MWCLTSVFMEMFLLYCCDEINLKFPNTDNIIINLNPCIGYLYACFFSFSLKNIIVVLALPILRANCSLKLRYLLWSPSNQHSQTWTLFGRVVSLSFFWAPLFQYNILLPLTGYWMSVPIMWWLKFSPLSTPWRSGWSF